MGIGVVLPKHSNFQNVMHSYKTHPSNLHQDFFIFFFGSRINMQVPSSLAERNLKWLIPTSHSYVGHFFFSFFFFSFWFWFWCGPLGKSWPGDIVITKRATTGVKESSWASQVAYSLPTTPFKYEKYCLYYRLFAHPLVSFSVSKLH